MRSHCFRPRGGGRGGFPLAKPWNPSKLTKLARALVYEARQFLPFFKEGFLMKKILIGLCVMAIVSLGFVSESQARHHHRHHHHAK
jgi:hypothetical protein